MSSSTLNGIEPFFGLKQGQSNYAALSKFHRSQLPESLAWVFAKNANPEEQSTGSSGIQHPASACYTRSDCPSPGTGSPRQAISSKLVLAARIGQAARGISHNQELNRRRPDQSAASTNLPEIMLNPPDFTDVLKAGVRRFNERAFPHRQALFKKLANGQNPEALFLTCADSRVVPALMTQTGPGQLFVERNPGNFVPIYREESVGVSASIEYAVAALRVKHVVVCGHSDCGVIKGLLHPEKVAALPEVARWMAFASAARHKLSEQYPQLPQEQQLAVLTELNVLRQIDNLSTHPSVRQALQEQRLQIHAWVHHIHSGEVWACNQDDSGFERWPGSLGLK
jgi:carbonic anhydrase